MKVRLEIAQRAINSRVWLDDVEVTSGVRGVVVTAHVDSVTEVVLTLLPKSIQIEGDAGRVMAALPEVVESEPVEG